MAPTGRKSTGAACAMRLLYSTQLRSDIRTVSVMTTPPLRSRPSSCPLDSVDFPPHRRTCRLDRDYLGFRPRMRAARVMHRDPSDQVVLADDRRDHFRADAVHAGDFLLRSDVRRRVEAVVFDEDTTVLLQPLDRNGIALIKRRLVLDRVHTRRQRFGRRSVDVEAELRKIDPQRRSTRIG